MTINSSWRKWGLRTLLAIVTALLTYWLTGKAPQPQIDPLPDEPIFEMKAEYGQGWIDDQDSVAKSMATLERIQGFKPVFAVCAAGITRDEASDTSPVFNWFAEKQVLGRILPAWNQGKLGVCVSKGHGRAVQDLMLIQIAKGDGDWPGFEVATEPIYGGSRINVGTKLHGVRWRGEGSVGAFAAEWLTTEGGTLFRKQYDGADLTNYSDASNSLSVRWGNSGVPAPMVAEAKKHPVQSAALVTTSEELWAALGNGYPVPVCSSVGFESPLRNGFCEPAGSWGHCMLFRGRFVHPTKGKCFVIQNSWGDYLGKYGEAAKQIDYLEGGEKKKIALPEGCFAVTAATASRMLAERDSFALSGFKGFPRQKIDWLLQRVPPRPQVAIALPE